MFTSSSSSTTLSASSSDQKDSKPPFRLLTNKWFQILKISMGANAYAYSIYRANRYYNFFHCALGLNNLVSLRNDDLNTFDSKVDAEVFKVMEINNKGGMLSRASGLHETCKIIHTFMRNPKTNYFKMPTEIDTAQRTAIRNYEAWMGDMKEYFDEEEKFISRLIEQKETLSSEVQSLKKELAETTAKESALRQQLTSLPNTSASDMQQRELAVTVREKLAANKEEELKNQAMKLEKLQQELEQQQKDIAKTKLDLEIKEQELQSRIEAKELGEFRQALVAQKNQADDAWKYPKRYLSPQRVAVLQKLTAEVTRAPLLGAHCKAIIKDLILGITPPNVANSHTESKATTTMDIVRAYCKITPAAQELQTLCEAESRLSDTNNFDNFGKEADSAQINYYRVLHTFLLMYGTGLCKNDELAQQLNKLIPPNYASSAREAASRISTPLLQSSAPSPRARSRSATGHSTPRYPSVFSMVTQPVTQQTPIANSMSGTFFASNSNHRPVIMGAPANRPARTGSLRHLNTDNHTSSTTNQATISGSSSNANAAAAPALSASSSSATNS